MLQRRIGAAFGLVLGGCMLLPLEILAQQRQVAIPPPAAEPESAEAPTFRTSTELVQVDVVVTKKGDPLAGLTKDDFELFDNGVKQTIAVFSSRDHTPPRPQPKMAEGVVSNRPGGREQEPLSTTVILFDRQNTPVKDQASARIEILQYLEQAPPGELIAFYELDQALSVVQEFTDDPDVLRAQAAKLRASQSANLVNEDEDSLLAGVDGPGAAATAQNAQQRRVDIVRKAFEMLAQNLRGLPGRKKVVWISAALPLTVTQETKRLDGNTYRDFFVYADEVFAPVKALNAANIALYPVDPRGNKVSLADPNRSTMIQLASKTGGKPFYNFNFIVPEGIRGAIEDSQVSYTLGFYPTAADRQGREHSIKVKVRGDDLFSGIDVRYRQSYQAEEPVQPHSEKQREDKLDEWVQQPINSMDVPIYARLDPSPNLPGFFNVHVAVDIGELHLTQENGRYTGSIDLAVVPDTEFHQKGLHQTVAINLTPETYAAALEGGLIVSNRVQGYKDDGKRLAKQFHVVVMDNRTLKAGSVRLPIPALP